MRLMVACGKWLGRLLRGMVVASESLGIALGVAVVCAIATTRANTAGKIWGLPYAGGLQEGTAWESLQLAVAEGLSNLRLVFDSASMRVETKMADVTAIGDVASKLQAIGLDVHEKTSTTSTASTTGLLK